jgi:two-component system CheB/CheR fusion protein
MAAIVESSEDAIASISLDGRFVSWNNAAERIFGYTAGEIIGQPMVRLAAPGYVTEMVEIVERIRRGGHIDHYETKRRHKDGRLLDVSLTESPIYDADRQLIGISKVLRDITAAKAAEAALRESQTRLQELHSELLRVSRLSAMGQMSATVTHELNQPLTAITNYMAAAAGIVDRGGEVPLSRLRNTWNAPANRRPAPGISLNVCAFSCRGAIRKSELRLFRHCFKKRPSSS